MNVIRGLILGSLVGGISLACSSSQQRDFGISGAGGADGSSGAAGDSTCSEEEYDDGASCKKLTTCERGEYEQSPPTPESDRVCAPLSSCGAGTFVSTEPTETLDRACSACEKGTFSSVLNAEECAPWAECQSGESESVPPSATSDRVCSTCGTGKYQLKDQCQLLTVCRSGQYESTPATAVSDRVCEALTACQPGSKQTAAPTTTTDRQCAACSSGTFSTQVNASTCDVWTTCTAGQDQTMAGSASSDVVCVDKLVCSTAKGRTCTTECPCASAEGVCTNSNQCVSGASCVAGSGKKVGRVGDTCLATHCDNDKLDTGESSIDCGGECGCRATLEILGYKNIPSGAIFTELNAMSRDGKRLAGTIARDHQTTYPVAIAAQDGAVTELESYGKGGTIVAASADGNVLVGSVFCGNPPTCTDVMGSTLMQWTGSSAPTWLVADRTARAISSSGAIVAGEYYDSSFGREIGFLLSIQGLTSIPELTGVAGLTPDGKYVAGPLQNGTQAGLWFAQTKEITKIGAANWTSISVNGVNGTDPAVIGNGYIQASDSYVGFRWKGGVMTQFGLLAGGVYSLPYAISSDGSTVVGVTGTNGFQQAFIWTDKDKLRTIIDEVKSRGLEPALDLELTNASFLSDDGKTIVGIHFTQAPSFWRVVLE